MVVNVCNMRWEEINLEIECARFTVTPASVKGIYLPDSAEGL